MGILCLEYAFHLPSFTGILAQGIRRKQLNYNNLKIKTLAENPRVGDSISFLYYVCPSANRTLL